MSKVKILGEKYGITITRPWSKEMYIHNDKVAEQMKAQIAGAIIRASSSQNEESMRTIGKAINAYGYGHGMTFQHIYEDCIKGLEHVPHHFLNSDTWPDLIKAGLVQPIDINFIGYDK